MSTTYKDLLKQREALEQQIQEARKRETADAVAQVRTLVADFGLTAEDIFQAPRSRAASSAKGGKVAAKYRNPATGETWTGRGKAPKWIQDQDRNQFLIAA
ncbi:H-NS histone family protein [Curvibacter sp. RS43]|uniref:H-NS histone family protein n=1 Tax=Curvibacter microcysteis TaxID=3026419 RepID=A0ABT5MGJ0_9BURK|nr:MULTISPECIES: H-NS histone family protein [unclassified Curvibacter]MDD0810594.1 H-NS histone family protein [Curvibacter sp. RS43]MDD0815668.1 H-NS histone family protein [Curvibacter sp. HBC28]